MKCKILNKKREREKEKERKKRENLEQGVLRDFNNLKYLYLLYYQFFFLTWNKEKLTKILGQETKIE